MASFVQSLMRLAGLNRRQSRTRPDEERATTADSAMGSSTLPPSHMHGMMSHRVTGDDALTLFRVTLGITAAPHLGFSSSAGRPADNVGLYARVVHSEQKAKDNYKVFSAVINACYFLQIIVAAALTALGAANANNKAITAFGAINTIVAGLLAYLKGSGYPARFKYYANEWKKVREFIEHRERDFSLEGCTLDVFEEVDTVREMYEATKREIEINTPDSFNSKNSMQFHGVDQSKAEAIAGKLRGLDGTVRKLRSHMPSHHGGVELKADGVVGKLHGLEDTLEKVRARVEKTIGDGHDAAHHAVDAIQDEEKRVMTQLRGLGKEVIAGVEERRPQMPREVSITVSHHDGDNRAGVSESPTKK